MTVPFQPAGERARWRIVYDLVMSKKYDDEILYRDVEDMLQVDRRIAQQVMRETTFHLLRDGQKTVETVRNFGWRVIRPGEHARQAEKRGKKARRQVRWAKLTVDSADARRDEMTVFERQRNDDLRARTNFLLQLHGKKALSMEDLRKQIEGPKT